MVQTYAWEVTSEGDRVQLWTEWEDGYKEIMIPIGFIDIIAYELAKNPVKKTDGGWAEQRSGGEWRVDSDTQEIFEYKDTTQKERLPWDGKWDKVS